MSNRRNITRHVFAFIAAFIFSNSACAGNPILFSSFFAEKNLSSPNITCFLQDRRGHMWIGTYDGLNYFDGKSVRIFKHDRLNKHSLADNLILNMSEDKAGNIWVASSWGISRLNPDLLEFENFQKDSRGDGLGFKPKVYTDKENNIWVVSGNLYRLNPGSGQFEKKALRNTGTSGGPAPKLYTGIFQDSKKRYWITCNNNLYRYFPDNGTCVPFAPRDKKIFFHPVMEDHAGNLFCGTWNDGLLRINTATNTLEQIEPSGLHGCYTEQNLNGSHLLWYGNSLSSYDPPTKKTARYLHDNADPYSARNDDISALFADSQNQLWIGYATKGIQIVSPSNQVFETYTVAEKENMFPCLTCFIQTRQSRYAGGWYNYSLVRLDGQNKPLKSWKTLIPGVTPNENNISDAWADGKGNIWFTSSFGLIQFNEQTEKTQLFRMDSTVSKNNHFLQIAAEGDSVLWISGYFCGLTRFSLQTHKLQNWGADNGSLFWSIVRDTSGMLWLANNGGILTGFDPVTKTFSEKKYTELTENCLYTNIIYDRQENALWIASPNGLLRVDRRTFKGTLFTEKDNLPTSQVNAMQFDSSHHLWIATNNGLCMYDPKENTFRTFFSNNGLPGNVLNRLFKMLPNNELLIGCKDGFSVLKTNAIPAPLFTPRVTIDRVYESGKIVTVTLVNAKKTIDLNYDQNDLHIEFSSNDLVDPEDNQLLFRLEGFDNTWHTAQNGQVNYNKLAPGNYLFHVNDIPYASNTPDRGDYLVIIIHPPFWKRTWFILLVSMALFGITLFVARYVFTRNLREKILRLEKVQAIEKERNRISQDMHDELGSGLTKISILSEVAIKQLDNLPKAAVHLETISSSARTLVDNLQDIIWVLNPRNDSLENLCSYLREYALNYFESTEISVRIHFPEAIPNIKLTEDQRRNILLVFKESFNNISRHSGGTLVSVSMILHKTSVTYTVTDNGKGFDKQAVRSFANGLGNMKKRMLSINGSFSIHSALQQGSRSEFTFNL